MRLTRLFTKEEIELFNKHSDDRLFELGDYCYKSEDTHRCEIVNKLGHYEDIDESPEHLEKIKKALEIIKNKWVNIEVLIQSKTLDDYNTTLCVHDLTKKEYDLLKEVLTND